MLLLLWCDDKRGCGWMDGCTVVITVGWCTLYKRGVDGWYYIRFFLRRWCSINEHTVFTGPYIYCIVLVLVVVGGVVYGSSTQSRRVLVVETTGTISDMHCSTTLFLCVWGERERDGKAADEIVCVFDNTILCTAIAILRLFVCFF